MQLYNTHYLDMFFRHSLLLLYFLLLGCPKTNFGLLSRREPHWPDVNICIRILVQLKGHHHFLKQKVKVSAMQKEASLRCFYLQHHHHHCQHPHLQYLDYWIHLPHFHHYHELQSVIMGFPSSAVPFTQKTTVLCVSTLEA